MVARAGCSVLVVTLSPCLLAPGALLLANSVSCGILTPPACSGGWVQEFQAAADKLSYTDAAKSSGESLFGVAQMN